MKTYSEFLKLKIEVDAAVSKMARLGIHIEGCFFRYTYNEIDYIRDAVKADDTWSVGLPLAQSVALCLACTEEDRNNHIDEEEIEMVNKFFNIKVTRELVRKMHGKYI